MEAAQSDSLSVIYFGDWISRRLGHMGDIDSGMCDLDLPAVIQKQQIPRLDDGTPAKPIAAGGITTLTEKWHFPPRARARDQAMSATDNDSLTLLT